MWYHDYSFGKQLYNRRRFMDYNYCRRKHNHYFKPIFDFSGVAGTTYVLQWTITNDPCPPSSSQVTINFKSTPTTANNGN
jgi:hypothetical protein